MTNTVSFILILEVSWESYSYTRVMFALIMQFFFSQEVWSTLRSLWSWLTCFKVSKNKWSIRAFSFRWTDTIQTFSKSCRTTVIHSLPFWKSRSPTQTISSSTCVSSSPDFSCSDSWASVRPVGPNLSLNFWKTSKAASSQAWSFPLTISTCTVSHQTQLAPTTTTSLLNGATRWVEHPNRIDGTRWSASPRVWSSKWAAP